MSSQIYDLFHKNNIPQIPKPFGNMQNFMKQFNAFRSAMSGNPKQQVEELLRSGKMTQEQYNQLSTMARQLEGMMRK